MNIESPTGEQLGQLLVLIRNECSPYSILFPFIHVTTTFAVLKDMVWQRCTFMGLSNRLGNSNHYHWEFVNKDGEVDTVLIMDEQIKSLKDINWSVELDAASNERTTTSLLSVLRLVQTPDADLHETQMKINKIIGANMERQRFECEAHSLADDVFKHKLAWIHKYNASPKERLLMDFPLQMAETPFKPSGGGQKVLLKIRLSEHHETTQGVGITDTAEQLIESLVDIYSERSTDQALDPKKFVLKIVGREQYLSGHHIVCQQKDVKFMLECQRYVSFSVLSLIPRPEPPPLPEPKSQLVLVRDPSQSRLLYRQFTVPESNDDSEYKCHTIHYDQLLLNIRPQVSTKEDVEGNELNLLAGLSHGNNFLNPCTMVRLSSTNDVGPEAAREWHPTEDRTLLHGLFVSNLPRSARLCLALVVPQTASSPMRHLGWANIPVFDHDDCLNVGQFDLHLWNAEDYCGPRRDPTCSYVDGQALDDHVNRERLCRPLGLPGGSPDESAPLVTFRLDAESVVAECYTSMSIPNHLYYPDWEVMMEIAASIPVENREFDGYSLTRIKQVASSDVLQDLADQDIDFLWNHRFALLEYPTCLPRLHQCVEWSNSIAVAQYYSLLKGWPHDADPLNAGMFLELLHHSFPDKRTRDFAVERGLAHLDDQMVVAFLPQIIQCLKYESYIDSALARFLLKRASVCPEIGNALYYHMRAEMRQSACVAERFAQLLNIYFLSSVERVDPLYRMSEAVERLSLIQRRLQKDCDSVGKEFQSRLNQWNQTFSNLRNPLFYDTKLHRLKPNRCEVFDSKMRPLMLRWSSEDNNVIQLPRHSVIYKSGDDLRQDVLTVQILAMMELIWDREHLPLRLFPYRVMSLGPREGFIECIWEAETLSSIRAKMAACNGTNYLYVWLRQKCDEQRGDIGQAVEQFRMTCAAYCVATYVLGIGDRHNDNIMLTQSGNLYHIDFGHFLGNFKRFKRLNIAREFVSFLLVDEFKFVITDGARDEEALKRFRRLCVDAFMSLRKHANLLLTLFLIMADIGMPELNSPDNLEFLRSRLCLEKTESEAKYLFQQKMAEDDTFFRKWTVKTTWNIHDFVHKK